MFQMWRRAWNKYGKRELERDQDLNFILALLDDKARIQKSIRWDV